MMSAAIKHPVYILGMILGKTLAGLSILGTEIERPQMNIMNFDEFHKLDLDMLKIFETSIRCFKL